MDTFPRSHFQKPTNYADLWGKFKQTFKESVEQSDKLNSLPGAHDRINKERIEKHFEQELLKHQK